MGVSDPEIQKKVFGPRMAARSRKTGLVSVEEVHPSPSTMSNLPAQKARSKNAMSANALIAPVDLFPSAVLPIIACCASANWAAEARA